ncbi:MAG: hypothetical protein IJ728_02755 [Selenomonadaceae bacterium]|nr:hypothetical protein [Selenomonadaceae bacterium]
MFDFLNGNKKTNVDASRMLAAILVVYPSVQAVSYDPKDGMLELSFALRGQFSQDQFENFLKYVADSVEAYHTLENLGSATIELNVEGIYQTCFINVRRDMATLTCGELSLLTELAINYFGENLIEEFGGAVDEEYYLEQEEYLEQMLSNIRQIRIENKLVGVREHERVVIYNNK